MVHSASKIPFFALCNILENIQGKGSVAEKRKALTEFVEKWRTQYFDQSDPEDSFYPMLRCIVPQLEKVAYGIKQHSMGKLYIEVLRLGKKSDAANILMNYKNPTSSTIVNKTVGDFAECAYGVLKDRSSVQPKLSVLDVVNKLNDIANGYTGNDKGLVKKTIEYLIKNLTGLENKWFIRMLVKDMKLGLGHDNILTTVHPDAPALFNVDTNLERVCKTLRDSSKRLHEIEVSLFAPLKPMLGKQAKPNEVESELKHHEFIIERKFDGERMQLHMKDGEYRYYSRNGHDFTSTYGKTRFDGNLTPRIHEKLKSVKNCILDGEMCGYDEELQVFGTKAMNFDIKSTTSSRYTPCYVIFDVLYLNDEVLTNKPLKERLKLLPNVVEEKEGTVMISSTTLAKTNKECLEALNQAIDRYEEGIMVKDPEAVYKPNSRTAGWYKIKPEYVDGLMDELDIVIVGGYFGKGRRSNILSHFLCAVLDDSNKEAPAYQSMCRIGSGYTYKELLDFNLKLKDKWQKTQPPNVFVSREKPEFWIDPSKSAILQVKATEIIEGTPFYTKYTLRFPRVTKIRDDKGPEDCLTLAEFHNLRNKRSGQLTSGLLSDDLLEEPQPKKRRQITTRSVAPTLPDQFKAADTADITQEADVFSDKEFCIVQGSDEFPKHRLEQEIVRLGGTFVQNAGPETFCIVTSKINMKVRNYMKASKYNIARLEWLVRCIEERSVLPWQPSDMISVSRSVQEEFHAKFDSFGDSYTGNTSEENLKKIFELMNSNDEFKTQRELLSSDDLRELEEEYTTNEDYDRSLFRPCRLYDGDKGLSSQSKLAVTEAKFYGASVFGELSDDVTHCICHNSQNIAVIQTHNRSQQRKVHVVSPLWVSECITSNKLVEERDYPPAS